MSGGGEVMKARWRYGGRSREREAEDHRQGLAPVAYVRNGSKTDSRLIAAGMSVTACDRTRAIHRISAPQAFYRLFGIRSSEIESVCAPVGLPNLMWGGEIGPLPASPSKRPLCS